MKGALTTEIQHVLVHNRMNAARVPALEDHAQLCGKPREVTVCIASPGDAALQQEAQVHTARRIFLMLVVMTSAALALTAGPASAGRLSVDERGFELVWNEAIGGKTAASFMDAAGHNIRCKVTLLGEWNQRVITKVPTGVAIINHGLVRECVGGTVVLEAFPWTLRYRSFTGILPAIATIDWGIVGAKIVATAEGLTCEAISEATNPLVVRFEGFAGGRPQNVRADETRTIPLVGGFLCSFASPARVAGRGLVSNLIETEFLNFRLI